MGEVEERVGRYNTKEKSKFHVTWKREYIPEESPMLADQNEGGQPNRAGEIIVQGKMKWHGGSISSIATLFQTT
jgi:hypothetical protein